MATYKDSGVDVELGNVASEILFNAAKQTWKNREGLFGEMVNLFDDFSGVRGFDVSGLPEGSFMSMGFDGVGTKIEIAERHEKYDTIAFDLFAMVCDDTVVKGFEPVALGTVLDVRSLRDEIDEPFMEELKQLAKGYVAAAEASGVIVINGEMAELGTRVYGYGSFNSNWSAGVIWIAQKERVITGRDVKAGDALVGFAEEGFRSNGLSLVRKILAGVHGEDWHEDSEMADQVLVPSTIYTKAMVEMFGGYLGLLPKAVITGAAHITGGGIPEKLGRMLKPSGFGADISDPLMPCNMMHYLQHSGGVSDEEAYKTWNMGCGMIVATPDPDPVIEIAGRHGIKAQVIGVVSDNPGIRIKSMGHHQLGQTLTF